MHLFANIIGLIGDACIVSAYFLMHAGRLTNKHLTLILLNLSGAVMILFSLYFYWNLPSVVMEIVWIGISLMGIWKVVRERGWL